MRVVVVGATGNVGTSLLQALAREPQVESVLGIARRLPHAEFEKAEFAAADVSRDELAPLLRGADCVVHLAWLIQPSHDLDLLRRVNVEGSARVFRAVADAGVPALVHASSIGVYSPGPKAPVDEGWPREGVPTSWYARQKAEVERRLDRLERERPDVAVARLRPALIMKREAGEEVRRLFLGPLAPARLLAPGRIPFVPDIPGLRLQVVHSLDAAEAYRLAIVERARGAFNVAADPVLGPAEMARALRTRTLRVPAAAARAAAAVTWRLRLQPTSPGWVDLALRTPLLDSRRVREELGWSPRFDALETLAELASGIAAGAGLGTPPLARETSGPLRSRELATRVGGEP